jgi:hypothetical protein
MTIKIDMKMDVRELNRTMGLLQANLRDRATVMAINKTAKKAKTEMDMSIRKEFNLPKKKVNSRLQIKKANRFTLSAEIDPFGLGGKRYRALNMVEFLVGSAESKLTGSRTAKGNLRRRTPLQFKIKKNGAAKSIKGAFVARGRKSGKLLVFAKDNTKASGIRAVSTIDVPQMFNTKRVQVRVMKRIRKEFPVEWERAAKHVLRQEQRRFNK